MKRRPGAVVVALCAVLVGGLAVEAGFGGDDGPQATVTVVGSATKVRPTSTPAGTQGAALVAARNEFESFQVVVRAGSAPLRGVSVTLARPLAGPRRTLPRHAVTIYRQALYDVREPSDPEGERGKWPDALIPAVDPLYGERRHAFPIDVPVRESRATWIDVLVPRGTPPGVYRGALAVRARGLRRLIPIRLTVLRLTLPSTPSFETAFGMDTKACLTQRCAPDAEWRHRALYARSALDNRISISTPYRAPLSDRARFRRTVEPLLRGRAPTRLRGARLTSLEVEKGDPLARWRRLVRAVGAERRAFVYACDEPNREARRWEDCRAAAAGARAVWSDVPILVTASIVDAQRFGAASLLDTLATSVHEMDDKRGEYAGSQRARYDDFLRRPGSRLWLYTACEAFGCSGVPSDEPYGVGWPGYAIDSPASEGRAMGWLAFSYGATGQLHWAVDRRLETAWTDQFAFGGNGDGTLFYPGTRARIGGRRTIPIESLRLKLIRDGVEDYEYLRFLARHGRRRQAVDVAAGLFPSMHDTVRDDAGVQEARRRLASLVAEVAGGPGP